MEKNEVKKFLYKNKEVTAKISRYTAGNLYYTVQLEDGLYEFPIATVQSVAPSGSYITNGVETYNLSADLGTTDFDRDIKASFLNRWVDKAISNGTFIKI